MGKEHTQGGPINELVVFETEVLAVQDGRPTKSRVRFAKNRLNDEPRSLEGNTYVVEWADGEVTRTTADGAPVPETDSKFFGQAENQPVVYPSRTLKPRDALKVQGVPFKATFERRDGDTAILRYASGSGALSVVCHHTVRIRDSRPVSIKCSASPDGGSGSVSTVEHTYH